TRLSLTGQAICQRLGVFPAAGMGSIMNSTTRLHHQKDIKLYREVASVGVEGAFGEGAFVDENAAGRRKARMRADISNIAEARRWLNNIEAGCVAVLGS